MKKLLSLGMAAGLMAFATAAFAYPTLLGQTGTGVQPNADVLAAGTVNVAVDYYSTSDDDIEFENTYPARVLFSASDNLEVGAGYQFLQVGGEDANAWTVNAKYQTPLTIGDFAWSLGALYRKLDVDALAAEATVTQATFVGTRPIMENDTVSLRGSIGANWTQVEEVDEVEEVTTDVVRPFIGVEADFGNGLLVAADYQFSNENLEGDALYSVVARYAITDAISAQLGFTNASTIGVTGTDESNIFAGVNFAFGGDDDDF